MFMTLFFIVEGHPLPPLAPQSEGRGAAAYLPPPHFQHPWLPLKDHGSSDWLIYWVLSTKTEEGNICKHQGSCIGTNIFLPTRAAGL